VRARGLARRADGAGNSRRSRPRAGGCSGACNAIFVAELGGEKIDVIPWNDDPGQFVANALSPAQVLSVDIDQEHRIANVTVPERMLSLAIGREGQNARLAARLTGWRIDIRSDVSTAEARAAKIESGVDGVQPAAGEAEVPAAAQAAAAMRTKADSAPNRARRTVACVSRLARSVTTAIGIHGS